MAFPATYPAAALLGRPDPHLLVAAPAVVTDAVVVATSARRRSHAGAWLVTA